MATQYWTGGNTLAAAGWSGAGLTDGDVFVFGQGNDTITNGLDTTGSTTNGIERLEFAGTFTGTVGSAGNPAIIEFDATPTGSPQIKAGGNAWVAYIRPSGGTVGALWMMGGTLYLDGSQTISNIYLLGGTLFLNGSVDADNIIQTGGRLVASSGVTQTTTAYQSGGISEYAVAPATFTVLGNAVSTVDSQTANFTTVNSYGGRLRVLAGNIPTLNGRPGGVVDVRDLVQAATIGASAFTRVGNFQLLGRDSTLLTVSNETTIAGGEAAPPPL